MRVKICGITCPEDAQAAERAGADAIGVVLASASPRSVTPEKAREIYSSVGPFITRVAVTHTTSREDLDTILALHPDAIQISHAFSFDYDPGVRVIRVLAKGDRVPDDCDGVIVDESHGAGRMFDLSYACDVVARAKVPVILAGGLTPDNVAEAIRKVRPYAVDVSSGVGGLPGKKDHRKIRAFIQESKRFEAGA